MEIPKRLKPSDVLECIDEAKYPVPPPRWRPEEMGNKPGDVAVGDEVQRRILRTFCEISVSSLLLECLMFVRVQSAIMLFVQRSRSSCVLSLLI